MAIDLGNGNDNFTVTNAAGESVRGFGGNDTLTGGSGRDALNGNEGDDILFGTGNDTLYGGQGNDALLANDNGSGDVLYGGKGVDVLIGSQAGGTLAFGGKGSDVIYGAGPRAILFGDLGDDVIFSKGNSSLAGGSFVYNPAINDGNDTLVGGFDNQVLAGDTGNNTYLFQNVVSRTLNGRTVLEGGYGGVDAIQRFQLGDNGYKDVILLTNLVSGDTVTISDQNSPNSITGSVISITGSVQNVIDVELIGISSLLTSNSNSIFVNGNVLDFSKGSFDAGSNVFTYRV